MTPNEQVWNHAALQTYDNPATTPLEWLTLQKAYHDRQALVFCAIWSSLSVGHPDYKITRDRFCGAVSRAIVTDHALAAIRGLL